jgi:peptidoglycan/xylan/chitin deacetylase (PgdA/CDA1 family)
VFGVARWLTRHRLRILCYHGFSSGDEAEFRPKLFIDPERFADRLMILKRNGWRVMALEEAIEKLYTCSLPPHTVVITVDDGFHSFYSLALPRLVRHAFPATVYVTTYYVRKAVPVFRLVVQYMFWKTRKEAALLNGSWGEKGSVDLSNLAESQRAIWEIIDFGERMCSENQRQQMCAELGTVLEVPFDEVLASRALHLMSESELRSLESASVSVGLHTHRHRFPGDDRDRAVREVVENRQELSALIGNVVPHFCYPSGEWQKHEWEWLDSLGIRSSTTCVPGLNGANTPRHALRRYLDGDDVHSLEFEAAICGVLDALHGVRALLKWSARIGRPLRAVPELD